MNEPPEQKKSIPTRSQIERSLIHRIQALYYERLGKRPGKITCQFFDEKLVIILENYIILPEQFLIDTEKKEFANKLRKELEQSIKPILKTTISEIVGVEVLAVLSDSDLDNKIAGFIAVLSEHPDVRDLESIPKVKKDKNASPDTEKQ